jgi:glycosyltransferase involved in cell wall biosynthesis
LEYPIESPSVSIIIPTFNGANRIGNCLDALRDQVTRWNGEILVVDDGSTDGTGDVVRRYPSTHLITQKNAGPAAARNRGASEARGTIILFTDDDCVPMPNWMEAMLKPFDDPEVVGAKGVYRTKQKELAARFVQLEYEDRYRMMAKFRDIDFVDTYSAAFRRERFLEMEGYDTSFPVACAEDIELSYRMSAHGWKMKFVPNAMVYHTHPNSFWRYLKKKYKFAFWRVLAVKKNPNKGIRDSHTPQLMKLQLLFGPALLSAVGVDLVVRWPLWATMSVCATFLITTLPFALRAITKDLAVGMLSPLILAARACAQVLGVMSGVIFARHRRLEVPSKPAVRDSH